MLPCPVSKTPPGVNLVLLGWCWSLKGEVDILGKRVICLLAASWLDEEIDTMLVAVRQTAAGSLSRKKKNLKACLCFIGIKTKGYSFTPSGRQPRHQEVNVPGLRHSPTHIHV